MKNFLFLLLIFLLLHGNAQVNFQQGYIIDNTGKNVQCYIKNKDWKKNPTSITYKLKEGASEETLMANQIKEFKINGTDHFYKGYKINKEIAGSFFEEMQLSNSFVLLKVLVDGQFDLYELHTTSRYYFFYEKDNELVLLDYRKTIDENNKVKEDAKFKRQLFDDFKCNDLTLEDYSNLRYNSMSLSDFFSKYNQCYGGDYVNLHSQRTKAKVNFKVRGGLNINSSLANDNSNSYILRYTIGPFSGSPQSMNIVRSIGGVENYNTTTDFSFGTALEIRLPFDQNNWSVFLAPNYQNVSETDGSESFSEPDVADFEFVSTLSCSFIQIPIGVRRYFDVNNRLEIYAHLAYTQNLVLNSDEITQITEIPTSTRPYTLKATSNREANNSGGYFGVGLSFLGKYGLDINYYGINLNLDDANQIRMKGYAISASYTIF